MEEKNYRNMCIVLIFSVCSVLVLSGLIITNYFMNGRLLAKVDCACTKCDVQDKGTDNESFVDDKNEEDDQAVENEIYSYENIVGVYYANVVYDGDYDMTIELSLNDDYTFVYSHNYPSGHRIYGNYVVEGDSIILNYLYSTGTADASLVSKNHKNVLKIGSDFSLIDSDRESTPSHFNVDSVTLLKDTEGRFKVRTFDDVNSLLKNKGIYEIDLFKDITC